MLINECLHAINSSLMSALSSILPDRFSLLSTTANNPLIIQDESLEDKGATIDDGSVETDNEISSTTEAFVKPTFFEQEYEIIKQK